MRRLSLACLLAAACAVVLLADTSTHVPTADGTTDNFTVDGCTTGSQFLCVDDPVGAPDEDTTFIFRTTNGSQDLITGAPSVPVGATVNSITVTARAAIPSGSFELAVRIRVDTTIFTDATPTTFSVATYADTSNVWSVNPVTTAAWTVAEVNRTAGSNNLTEIGVTATGLSSETARVTQVYLTVDYTPAAGGGGWSQGSQQLLIRSGQ